jgi:hypothetical protein
MRSHPQERIDSRPEPSPMAIIGAILAQGAIRFLDRQKREQRAAEKSINPAGPLQNLVTLRGVQDFRNITRAVQYADDCDLLCCGLKKDHVVAMRA